MAEDAKYGLVEPFDVDDGSLAGFKPNEIFTLGVEWEMFRQRLLSDDEPFVEQVHTANTDRLKRMCERHGRTCADKWLHEDYLEWRVLHVGGVPD